MKREEMLKKKRGRPAKSMIEEKNHEPEQLEERPQDEASPPLVPDDPQEAVDDSELIRKDLFRVDEVATYFSVSERCIRLWIDHGHFCTEKLHGSIRVTRQSILDFRLRSREGFHKFS